MNLKKLLALGLSLTMAATLVAGCGSSSTSGDTSGDQTADSTSSDKSSAQQVIIYSNADDEAITAMTHALDSNGYEGQYVFQTFGTSELGGKLLAEGTNLEADMVTMSTSRICPPG